MKSKLFSVIYWNLLTFSFIFLLSACTKFTLPAEVYTQLIKTSVVNTSPIQPTNTIPIVDVRVSNNLAAAVVSNTGIVISNDDKVINVWDYKNKKLLNSFNFLTTITKMVLSKNDSLLYVGGLTSTIQVYDWRTGKLTQSMTGTGDVISMRLSSDNNFLITIDYTISNTSTTNVSIFNLKNAEKIYSLSVPKNNSTTYDCALSKNAQYLALSSSNFLKIWDRNSNSIVADFSNTNGTYSAMDFSPDGTKLIVNVDDNNFRGVKLLDFLNNSEIAHIADPSYSTSLNISQDGKYCFTGFVYIDLQKFTTLWSIEGTNQTNLNSFLSSTGNYAIRYDNNGGTSLFDNNGNPVSRDPNVLNGWASTSTSFNNQLYILGGTQLLAMPQLGGTNTLYTSPKNQSFTDNIVFTSNTIVAINDFYVYFWNLSTNSFTNQISIYEPSNTIIGYGNGNLVISNDKKMVAVQAVNNLSDLLIYSMPDGSKIQTISGLTNATNENVIFTNDNKSIIGTSDNNSTINTWDISSGKLIASFNNPQLDPNFSPLLAITPDKKNLAVLDYSYLTFYDYASGSKLSNMSTAVPFDTFRYNSNLLHMKMSTDGKYLAVSAGINLKIIDMASISNNLNVRTYTTKYPIVGLEFDNSSTQLSVVSQREVSNFKL